MGNGALCPVHGQKLLPEYPEKVAPTKLGLVCGYRNYDGVDDGYAPFIRRRNSVINKFRKLEDEEQDRLSVEVLDSCRVFNQRRLNQKRGEDGVRS